MPQILLFLTSSLSRDALQYALSAETAIDGVRDGTAHVAEECVNGVSGIVGHM